MIIIDIFYFRLMNAMIRISGSVCCFLVLMLSGDKLTAQPIAQKLQAAYSRFESDPQLKYASISLHVIDATTGKIVFSKNAKTGLAPASTQKVISSVSAFEILGKGFQYKTQFAFDKSSNSIVITPGGDPTLGSERWANTRPEKVLSRLLAALPAGIKEISTIVVDESSWENHSIPQGWVWQDLANYYGAAPSKLNWRENQYDLFLKSGNRVGDTVTIVDTKPRLKDYYVRSEVKSAARGTGDNAYIYFPVNGNEAVVKGTTPINENRFSISGALPSGSKQLLAEISDTFLQKAIRVSTESSKKSNAGPSTNIFHTETSPALDSIIYWFNRKSINLYGEALLQTMAFHKKGYGSVDSGVAVVKEFWKAKDIDPLELNMVDGSGLSPMNRITTSAQVAVLQYAWKQTWFSSFHASLPEYNGIKMKSGTIRDVKGFCGYHTSNGTTYIFSFLVNNYNGSHSALVKKMYTVLDGFK